jgi:hypothetical protein
MQYDSGAAPAHCHLDRLHEFVRVWLGDLFCESLCRTSNKRGDPQTRDCAHDASESFEWHTIWNRCCI